MRGGQLQGAAAGGIAFNQLAFAILSACLQTCTSAQYTKYILLTTPRSGSTWTCSVPRSQPHVQCGMHHDGFKGSQKYSSELLIKYSLQKSKVGTLGQRGVNGSVMRCWHSIDQFLLRAAARDQQSALSLCTTRYHPSLWTNLPVGVLKSEFISFILSVLQLF